MKSYKITIKITTKTFRAHNKDEAISKAYEIINWQNKHLIDKIDEQFS